MATNDRGYQLPIISIGDTVRLGTNRGTIVGFTKNKVQIQMNHGPRWSVSHKTVEDAIDAQTDVQTAQG